MKRSFIFFTLNLISLNAIFSQCNTTQSIYPSTSPAGKTATQSQIKVIRINFHFMLKSDGTGNFTETTDGTNNSLRSGYDYARDLTFDINGRSSWNEKMKLPLNNNTIQKDKNYYYVLNAVYFHRNNNLYDYDENCMNAQTCCIMNHPVAVDTTNVINIILNRNVNSNTSGGYAYCLDPNSKRKSIQCYNYWTKYVNHKNANNPYSWVMDGEGFNTYHELGHTLNLMHTVVWCPAPGANCTAPGVCDDECFDTPTKWEVMQSNNCIKDPACGFRDNTANSIYCSSNIMDYVGGNSLTPCQIERIHNSLEGGMKTYLSCEAVKSDLTLIDVGYPKINYFGKTVTIGSPSSYADVSEKEFIKVNYSEAVELYNFEVMAGGEFEIIHESPCDF